MAAIRSRLPSSHDILLAFAAIVFPIHFQAFIGWMINVSSLIKRYTLWDTVGVIAHVHGFVLLESVGVLIVLVFLAVLLPEKYYRSQFVALSTMFILFTVPFVFVIDFLIKYRVIKLGLLIVLVVYFLFSGVFYWLVKKTNRVNSFFYNLTQILAPLSIFYVSIDLIAIFIIVVRKFLI